MSGKPQPGTRGGALRRRAESRAPATARDVASLSRDEIAELAQELQVHQIELELQNEDLRQAQQELETAHERYVDLYDFAPVGYFSLDNRGRIHEVNLTGSKLLDCARAGLAQAPFVRYVAASWRTTFHFHCKKVLETGSRQTCELMLEKAGGTPFWAQLVTVPVGESEGLRVAALDISERKKLETSAAEAKQLAQLERVRIEVILETMPAGVIIVEKPDGRVTYANGRALEVYGRDPRGLSVEERVSVFRLRRPDGSAYPPRELATSRALWRGEVVRDHELLATRPDGVDIVVLVSAAPLAVRAGEAPAAVGVFDDVTQRKQTEEDLKKYRQELEALVQERTEELRAVSRRLVDAQEQERRSIAQLLHDDIAQSLGFLKLLMAGKPKGDEGKERGLTQALGIVDELITKVRDLSLGLRPRMLDDLGLAATLEWFFDMYSAKTGMAVDFQHRGVNKRLPVYVSTALYRVVQEALTNVTQHAGVDKVLVRIEGNRHELRINIEDKGVGFDPAKAGSSSAGINSMRERMYMLKGDFRIDSAPGAGTRIALTVPLAAGRAKVQKAQA